MSARGGSKDSADVVPFLFIAVLLLAVFSRLSPRAAARRHFRALPESQREFTYEVGPVDFSITTADSAVRQTYSSLLRYSEGPSAFALYGMPQVAQLAPKRAFAKVSGPGRARSSLASTCAPQEVFASPQA